MKDINFYRELIKARIINDNPDFNYLIPQLFDYCELGRCSQLGTYSRKLVGWIVTMAGMSQKAEETATSRLFCAQTV
jgi:hypothetical protein